MNRQDQVYLRRLRIALRKSDPRDAVIEADMILAEWHKSAVVESDSDTVQVQYGRAGPVFETGHYYTSSPWEQAPSLNPEEFKKQVKKWMDEMRGFRY